MNTLQAKDYSSRAELENAVKALVGDSPDHKPDYEIRGTKEELEMLKLSDRTTIFGVRGVIIDDPTPTKTQDEVEKPMRGVIFPSGLNGNLKPVELKEETIHNVPDENPIP